MHVIITDGNQVFECETDYLEGEAKIQVNDFIEEAINGLASVFDKFEQPVINTFEMEK